MNRITRTSMHRLSPRATVVSGAALGLIAGATVYGAVSSSAQAPAPAAFTAKAPATAPARLANCAAGAKLEKGVCVVHVVRTVTLPQSAAQIAARAKTAPIAGSIPRSTVKPASEADDAKSAAGLPAPAASEKCSVVKTDEESDSKDSEDASRSTTPAPAPTACSPAAPAAAAAPAPSAAS
jgi:hypothetical protein